MFHTFTAASRIDYRRRARNLSRTFPSFSDATILASDYTAAEPCFLQAESSVVDVMCAHWAPLVASGEVSADHAAAKIAAIVGHTNPDRAEDAERLAFVILQAA